MRASVWVAVAAAGVGAVSACFGPSEVRCEQTSECLPGESCDKAQGVCVASPPDGGSGPDASSPANNDAGHQEHLPTDAGAADAGEAQTDAGLSADAGTVADAGQPPVHAGLSFARDTTKPSGAAAQTSYRAWAAVQQRVPSTACATADQDGTCCYREEPIPPSVVPSMNAGDIALSTRGVLVYDATARGYVVSFKELFAPGTRLSGASAGGKELSSVKFPEAIGPEEPTITAPDFRFFSPSIDRLTGTTVSWSGTSSDREVEISIAVPGRTVSPTVTCVATDSGKYAFTTKLLTRLAAGSAVLRVERHHTAMTLGSGGSTVTRATTSWGGAVTLR